MPEGKGYSQGNPAQHSGKSGDQYYPLGVDPKNEYAHEYGKNTEAGTYPSPKPNAAGETAFDHGHPALGDRKGGSSRGPNLEDLRS